MTQARDPKEKLQENIALWALHMKVRDLRFAQILAMDPKKV